MCSDALLIVHLHQGPREQDLQQVHKIGCESARSDISRSQLFIDRREGHAEGDRRISTRRGGRATTRRTRFSSRCEREKLVGRAILSFLFCRSATSFTPSGALFGFFPPSRRFLVLFCYLFILCVSRKCLIVCFKTYLVFCVLLLFIAVVCRDQCTGVLSPPLIVFALEIGLLDRAA